ncbi:MAG: hypothetical protein WA323_06655 [Candidatus Nitrosopolaris sp.]
MEAYNKIVKNEFLAVERIASFKIDPAMTDEKVKNFIQAKLISEQGESTANKL